MEIGVVLPLRAHDFNFDSSCSSPYMTAPPSPQPLGNFFFSAPASPTRPSTFYRDFNDAYSSPLAVPFDWEEKPGTPKASGSRSKNVNCDDGDEDFEFDFSGQLERTPLSAEELFEGGKIRLLKPPPALNSPRSPRSPRSPKFRISPKKDFDPFAIALEKTRTGAELGKKQRGRQRSPVSSSSSYVPKGSRSLSPLRVSDIILDPDHDNSQSGEPVTPTPTTPKSYASSILSAISFSKGYRKWRLKDFLLFRSASEGRVTDKDQLREYSLLSRKEPEDVKGSSFRSTDSVGSVSSRRRGRVSAHELHYRENRAESEELKRKTFLPYKQGLLGRLGFNPGVHRISRGIGSLIRG